MELFRRFLAEQDLARLARACYQCSVCAGGCPVGRWREDFNPRRFIEQILRDDLDGLLGDDRIWLCAACHTCLERCPQMIAVSEIMVQLKNAAARLGNIPEHEMKKARELARTGWVQSPANRTARIRRELGLPENPGAIGSAELSRVSDCLNWQEKLRALQGHEAEAAQPAADRPPAAETEQKRT